MTDIEKVRKCLELMRAEAYGEKSWGVVVVDMTSRALAILEPAPRAGRNKS